VCRAFLPIIFKYVHSNIPVDILSVSNSTDLCCRSPPCLGDFAPMSIFCRSPEAEFLLPPRLSQERGCTGRCQNDGKLVTSPCGSPSFEGGLRAFFALTFACSTAPPVDRTLEFAMPLDIHRPANPVHTPLPRHCWHICQIDCQSLCQGPDAPVWKSYTRLRRRSLWSDTRAGSRRGLDHLPVAVVVSSALSS